MGIERLRRRKVRQARWPVALAFAVAGGSIPWTCAHAQDQPETEGPAAETPATEAPAASDAPVAETPGEAAQPSAPASPPASPSAPPFWARPRPGPSNCDCDTEPAPAEPAPAGQSTLVPGILAGTTIVLLFFVWQRLRKLSAGEGPEVRAPPPRAPAAPAEPVLPTGFDARTRPQARKLAETGKEDLGIVDPNATEVEVGEAEPASQSAGA